MKRIHFVKLLFVAVLATGSLNAWGVDVTYTFSTASNNPGNAQDWTSDDIDAYTKWEATTGGQNAPKYYTTGSGLRVYNGGTFTISSTKVISSITLTFSSTGYTFSSSNTTTPQTIEPNTNSYSWDVSRTCRLQKIEITYSSGSTETTYSVTFNAGTNGTCSTKSLTEKSQNSGVTLPNCNPNTDYTFVGWATTSSATDADAGKAGEIYYPSEDCTLYAVYSAVQNYTVTWVVGSNPSKTQSYTTQVASGSKATPPAELTLTGSEIGDCVDTFVGWSKSTLKSPKDTPPSDLFTDKSPEAITANTTFNAVFAKKK